MVSVAALFLNLCGSRTHCVGAKLQMPFNDQKALEHAMRRPSCLNKCKCNKHALELLYCSTDAPI